MHTAAPHATHNNLVAMANQISDFFRFQGDDASAMESIAGHLNHFWAPSMRRGLVDHLDSADGDGMQPLVRAAVERYREKLLNRGAHVPGESQLEQPRGGGDAG